MEQPEALRAVSGKKVSLWMPEPSKTPSELKEAMAKLLEPRVETIQYSDGSGSYENHRLGWNKDPKVGHSYADDLMVEVLRSLGYGEAMDIYESQTRWCE